MTLLSLEPIHGLDTGGLIHGTQAPGIPYHAYGQQQADIIVLFEFYCRLVRHYICSVAHPKYIFDNLFINLL